MNNDIYKAIKKRILFMEYKPGHIFNENTLASEFGVSRTPMREVLSRLEWEQLVRIIPRTGTMITEIEFQKIMHAYQARLGIEGQTGKYAAEHITPDHLTKLEILQKKCGTLFNHKNPENLAQVDLDLRSLLHEAANNPVLKEMSDYLYNLTFRLWIITLDRGNWDDEVSLFLDELKKTTDLLIKKDHAGLKELRESFLIMHFDRIKSKYLGIGISS